LGALSVLTSAVLAAFFLNEELGRDGKIGSALSLIGAVIIILHAPEEPKVDSVDVILQYAVNPGFIVYSLLVLCTSFALICYVAPKHGRTNPLVYIAICSLVGSITVISCKALGIALKLTGEGNNQFVHLSTYVFILIVAVCIVTQMNYFNMALDIFSTSIVTPVYYVFFTTATIIATVILFKGIYDTSASNFVSVVFGFITIFLGVFLLNTKKSHSEAINNFYTERELGMDPLNNEEEAF
jgi:drug/metabolite transporter (DMT)-like permease